MMRLTLILNLAAKDWRLFWADRRAALLCFAVPIVLASAFGLIFARPTEDKVLRRWHSIARGGLPRGEVRKALSASGSRRSTRVASSISRRRLCRTDGIP